MIITSERSSRNGSTAATGVSGLIARPGWRRAAEIERSVWRFSSSLVHLDVEGDRVPAGVDEALAVARRLFDHQVDVDGQ
jgi:hypothetical protein